MTKFMDKFGWGALTNFWIFSQYRISLALMRQWSPSSCRGPVGQDVGADAVAAGGHAHPVGGISTPVLGPQHQHRRPRRADRDGRSNSDISQIAQWTGRHR